MNFVFLSFLLCIKSLYANTIFNVDKYDFGVGKVLKKICHEDDSHLMCSYDTNDFTPKRINIISNTWIQVRDGKFYLPLLESIAKELISMNRNFPAHIKMLKSAMGKSDYNSLHLLTHNLILALVYAESYQLAVSLFITFKDELQLSNSAMSNRTTPSEFHNYLSRHHPEIFKSLYMWAADFFPAALRDPTLNVLNSQLAKYLTPENNYVHELFHYFCIHLSENNPKLMSKVHSRLKSFLDEDKIKDHPQHKSFLAITDICYGIDVELALSHLKSDYFDEKTKLRLIRAGLDSENIDISRAVFDYLVNSKTANFVEIDRLVKNLQKSSNVGIIELWPLVLGALENVFTPGSFVEDKFLSKLLKKIFESKSCTKKKSLIYAILRQFNKKGSEGESIDIFISEKETYQFLISDKQLKKLLGTRSKINFKLSGYLVAAEISSENFTALKGAILKKQVHIANPLHCLVLLSRNSDFDKLFELINIEKISDDDKDYMLKGIKMYLDIIHFPKRISCPDKKSLEPMVVNHRGLFKYARGRWGVEFLTEVSKELSELLADLGV